MALTQALYLLITGIWPLIDDGTFQLVSGPKRARWLVETVGVVVAVIGAVLGLAGLRRGITPELGLLDVGSAEGLAAIEMLGGPTRVLPVPARSPAQAIRQRLH